MSEPSYLFPPSFKATLLGFFASRPRDDRIVTMLQQRIEQLAPSYVIDHALCQSCVDYLKKLPYEQVFQLINVFGHLEPVPEAPTLPQPMVTDPDVRVRDLGDNGVSEVST